MPVLNLKSGFADSDDLDTLMAGIGKRARAAGRAMALAPAQTKDLALRAIAEQIRASAPTILRENARDVSAAQAAGQTKAIIDRLTLDEGRVAAIAEAVEKVAGLPDPVGRQLAAFERPNGLLIERISVPLGVVGVIFESRPNVTADAGALCLKAGNAAILRAGSDSHRTATAIAAAMSEGLARTGLPADAIQLVPTRDRAAVGLMLTGLGGCVDVIVPRGGRSLVERVQAEAKVPVFAHLDGICHVYIAEGADLGMARTVLLNSKMRRTGICGAAETLLVDAAVAKTHLKPLVEA
ncbi:MAG TPA: glutamate-5-semialdehyde dehydrogenase, partial [Methylobacterium sp.]|nr:glutamate-5-semialdehyde dehydrogenase [Methylobacterium sp.]